jgi:type IV secretion system protein VirD4
MWTKPDIDEKKLKNISIILFFAAVVCAASAATQYTAAKLDYQEALYWSLWEFESFKIYNPFAVFAWNGSYRREAPVLFINAYSIFGGLTVMATLILVFIRLLFHKKTSDNYGSAQFATTEVMQKFNLLNGVGVILGMTDDGYYLREDDKTHIFLCAPTRSGKGVGVIIPTLLSWPHSVVVVDVKGENYDLTAGRRHNMGQIVLKFDPTNLEYKNPDGSYNAKAATTGARFNPFDEIRMGTPEEVKDCQNICRILADPTGKGYEGPNAHWTNNAADLLFGITLHLKWTKKNEPVNITSVLEFMAEDTAGLRHHLQEIVSNAAAGGLKHDETGEVLQFTNNAPDRLYFHPRVYQVFSKMASTPEKEFGSIQSTLETALSVYRDPIVAANMACSDFKVSDLMNYEKPVSLYLIVPPSDIERMMPAFRVIIEILYGRNTEKLENMQRLLMLLDEFPQLGKLETFETRMGVIAGYGIKALVICQSVMQINKIYGKDNGIISNCEVKIYYAPNDFATAELLSKTMGDYTREAKSSTKGSLQTSRSYNEMGRALMRPDEVMRLDPKKALIFKRGMSPILANKLTWYDNPDFKNLPDKPPAVTDKIPNDNLNWYEQTMDRLKMKDINEMKQEENEFSDKKVEVPDELVDMGEEEE